MEKERIRVIKDMGIRDQGKGITQELQNFHFFIAPSLPFIDLGFEQCHYSYCNRLLMSKS